MDFSHVSDVLSGKLDSKPVKLRGWVHRQRTSSNVNFIVLRDSTGILQVAAKKEQPKAFDAAGSLYVEASVTVEGTVKKDERAPGGWEIQATDIGVICNREPFPIAKDLSPEFLLDVRHLWLRSQKITAMMKARHWITRYMREFLDGEGFWEVNPPVLTKVGGEGGADMFSIDYFGEVAFLSQSAQLYGEALTTSLEKVYVWAPSFRAEPSRTVRHLAEYWHLEPEMAWYDTNDNMELQEQMISHVAQQFAKKNTDLLEVFGRDPAALKIVKPPFKRITYDKAVEMLNSKGIKKKWGEDLGAEDEKALTEDEKKPIFVTQYPRAIKPFYAEPDPTNLDRVLCDDCLAPQGHGELISGSQRVWKYETLVENMKRAGLEKVHSYDWYLDLRKYGAVPHAGFGIGLERLTKWLLNLDHIRDAIPFPRLINRIYP